jgi:hypothetical protein
VISFKLRLLSPEERAQGPTGQEAELAPEAVWILRSREESLTRNRTPPNPQPVAITTELSRLDAYEVAKPERNHLKDVRIKEEDNINMDIEETRCM